MAHPLYQAKFELSQMSIGTVKQEKVKSEGKRQATVFKGERGLSE